MPHEPAVPRAPWLAPDLLPPAALDGGTGVFWGGQCHPMSLDAIAAALRTETPEDKAPIRLVEIEDQPRVLFAAEVPALWPVQTERDLRGYEGLLKSQGVVALVLLALCVACLAIPAFRDFVFLPAVFGLQSGAQCVDALLERRRLLREPGLYFRKRALEGRYAVWLGFARRQELWRTYGMAAAWALIFLLQMAVGVEVSGERAALVKPLVWEGQAWRLLTGAMLHGNFLHIFMNVSAWLTLALLTERTASRHLLAPVWLLSALGGSLCSLFLLPGATSVGASGGLMGLLGFLAVMGWRRRDILPPDFGKGMFRSIGLMAIFGALAWAVIDNAGHGGGLVIGALLGAFAFRQREGSLPLPSTPALRLAEGASLAAFLGLSIFTALKVLGVA